MRKKDVFLLLVVSCFILLVNADCKTSSAVENPPATGGIDSLKTLVVTSTAFTHGEKIPAKYTCENGSISPPLSWSNVPTGVESFAVVFYDRTWAFVHMVVFDLPAGVFSLPEDINNNLPAGARFGKNDSKTEGYFGPCPDPGDVNDYCFYVYALDTVLNLSSETDRSQLMNAMDGHILAWGELLGIYH